MNVCITSVGRRNYLVEWFRQAGQDIGVDITMIVADSDRYAPAFDLGDISIQMPRFDTQSYLTEISALMERHSVDLLLSANDYEVSMLSRSTLPSRFAAIVVPPASTLEITEDKFATARFLETLGIGAPRTILGSEAMENADFGNGEENSDFVVKHRFGSGSSGVLVVPKRLLRAAISICAESARDRFGKQSAMPDPELVVVQERLVGREFGLDLVCDFQGRFQSVLAREKLSMRAGETDRAITVNGEPFIDLGASIASSLSLVGNTDMDVILTEDGRTVVIDINTRFGGGYPFSHLAGANVPACYLAWAQGKPIRPEWLQQSSGVVSGKYGAIKVVSL